MSTEFTFTLSVEDYLAASKLHFWQELKSTKIIAIYASTFAVLGALGFVFAWDDGHSYDSLDFWRALSQPILLGLIAFIVIVIVVYLSLSAQTRKLFGQHKMMQLPATYRIGNEALGVENQHSQGEFPYAMFHRWAADDTSLLIYHADRLFYIFPRRSVAADSLGKLILKLQEYGVPTRTKANKL